MAITFQRKTEVTSVESFVPNKNFHLESEKIETSTPPSYNPNMYPSQKWTVRRFVGGTIEDAIGDIELSVLEGCVVFWNRVQWTEATVLRYRGVALLIDKYKVDSPMKEESTVEHRELATCS